MGLKRYSIAALISILFLAGAMTGGAQDKQEKARPAKRSLPELYAEAQTRPDGKDVVFYMKGDVYAFIPGERPQRLFGLEGYNIRRQVATPEKDGYFQASREIVFYTDSKTDQIIWEWDNPFTQQKNEVFHIVNDPVNFRTRVRDGRHIAVSMDGKREMGEVGAPQEWDDYYVFNRDVFPFYPLPGLEKNYTAAEMFDYYIPRSDRDSDGPPSVMISWTRICPWLPWMGMGKHAGVMIYRARSKRMDSWEQLPDRVKKVVQEKFPVFQTAPAEVDPKRPNVTSWSYYAEEMKKRQAQ